MKKYKSTWHLFHFIMSVLTSGLWILIWIYCGVSNGQANRRAEFEALMNGKPR